LRFGHRTLCLLGKCSITWTTSLAPGKNSCISVSPHLKVLSLERPPFPPFLLPSLLPVLPSSWFTFLFVFPYFKDLFNYVFGNNYSFIGNCKIYYREVPCALHPNFPQWLTSYIPIVQYQTRRLPLTQS
jgi:hypothetical protein